MNKLGERTLWLDCDVIEADGGYADRFNHRRILACAWQSTNCKSRHRERESDPQLGRGRQRWRHCGVPMLDLNYVEDSSADVDFNLVMTDRDEFVEIQGTAERNPFNQAVLSELLELGRRGIHDLMDVQRRTLGM